MDFLAVSCGREILEPPGRQAVGRTKADAGGLACDRGAARAADRRRAQQGAGAGHHQQHDRRLRATQGQWRDHPAGGAEHQLRQTPGRQRGRDGQRRACACRRHAATGRGRGPAAVAAGGGAMKKIDFDWKPLVLVPLLAILVLPLIGSGSTWLTLTVAGLAMGMIIFIIASGLTLVFGLMDVLNFGHGVFIALGAFVAASVLGSMADWTGSQDLWRNMAAVLPAMLVAMGVSGAIGLAFERIIVRPVYCQHLN